jgi:hypothetical protein
LEIHSDDFCGAHRAVSSGWYDVLRIISHLVILSRQKHHLDVIPAICELPVSEFCEITEPAKGEINYNCPE